MTSRSFLTIFAVCALLPLSSVRTTHAQEAATTTTTTTTVTGPLRQGFGAPSGRAIVGQLKAASPTRPVPTRKKLTSKQRAAEAQRIARMTPAQRKAMVQEKYEIPPVGWLASYLPADRYKFGKIWQYVSTETDHYYYRPQDMARRKFNANRVIGFRTWQLAMLAGYRPDPVSKPAPGPQIVALARYARGPNFYRFVEYTYAGQVSPQAFEKSYTYAQKVANALARSAEGRKYMSNTLDRVFLASITGDTSVIPRTVGGPPPAPPTTTGAGGEATGATPNFPGGDNVRAPSSPDESGDVTQPNNATQRAANLARTPVTER